MRTASEAPGGERGRDKVAVIGMGCRLPGGCGDPEALWRLLRDGQDAIEEIPTERWNSEELYDPDPSVAGKLATRWGGFIDRVDAFDHEFFGISAREAEAMDPQQRLLLEVAWEALENAGQDVDALAGSRTGVFIGMSSRDYAQRSLTAGDLGRIDGYSLTGNAGAVAAGRISHRLSLRGPSMTVDTASSSSLVAVHLACQSLLTGESDLAIAGGVNLLLSPRHTAAMSRLRTLAADGRCKAFDARGDGYVRSEGCALVVLRRRRDAASCDDPVRAVIHASGVNHDGGLGDLTAPDSEAQEQLISDVLARAGIAASQVDYFEAHGTGTPLGDHAELRAIASVFASHRTLEAPLWIGSVKSNLGHAEAAAGVAGLIKAVLAIEHREIPPNLHLVTPNEQLAAASGKLRVPTSPTRWPDRDGAAATACVSSFGIGGTNAHLILGASLDADDPTAAQLATTTQHPILGVSARSPAALRALAERYVDRLRDDSTASRVATSEIARAAMTRRSHHPYRLAVTAASRADATAALQAYALDGTHQDLVTGRDEATSGDVVFVFPGQGSQWLGMTQELLAHEPAYRQAPEACDAEIMAESGWSVIDELNSDAASSRLDRVEIVQPTLLAVMISLAAQWRSQGVEPDAVIGHSQGEAAAAVLAGALSLRDAIRVVCRRSLLLREIAGKGRMAVVEQTREECEELAERFDGRLSLAAVNSPRTSVLSGDPEAIEEAVAQLTARGIFGRSIQVDVASHSPRVDPLTPRLLAALSDLQPTVAQVPMRSTVTGQELGDRRLDADYWVRNLRRPVQFCAAATALIADGHRHFVEISPHPVLVPAIQQVLAETGVRGTATATLRRHEPERRSLAQSLAALYVGGARIAWVGPTRGVKAPLNRLPSYPWQHSRFLLEPAPCAAGEDGASDPQHEDTTWRDLTWSIQWQPTPRPAPVGNAGPTETGAGSWLLVGPEDPWLSDLGRRLDQAGGHSVHLTEGGEQELELPSPPEPEQGWRGVVLWCCGTTDQSMSEASPSPPLPAISELSGDGGERLVTLIAELRRGGWRDLPPLVLVTRGLFSRQGIGPSALRQGAAWGQARTLAQERPELRLTCLDLDDDTAGSVAAGSVAAESVAAGSVAAESVAALAAQLTTPSRERVVRLGSQAGSVLRLRRAIPRVDRGRPPRSRPAGELRFSSTRCLLVAERSAVTVALARHLVAGSVGDVSLLACNASEVAPTIAAGSGLRAHDLKGSSAEDLVLALASLPDSPGQPESIFVVLDPFGATASQLRQQLHRLWTLHQWTAERPIGAFVVLAPIAWELGVPGQGAAAAAGVWIQALIRYRRSLGLPGTSLSLGPVETSGESSGETSGESDASWDLRGALPMSADELAAALEAALRRDVDHLIVGRIHGRQWLDCHPLAATDPSLADILDDPSPAHDRGRGRGRDRARSFDLAAFRDAAPARQTELLETLVRGHAARILRLAAEGIAPEAPLRQLGLDSIMGVELRNALEVDLDIRTSATLLLGQPTTRALAERLAERLAGETTQASPQPAPRPPESHEASSPPDATSLDALSDDELAGELARLLDGES